MDYFEVSLTAFGDLDPEIVMAQLAEIGFESFSETEDCLIGYIREEDYYDEIIQRYLKELNEDHGIKNETRKIEARNWNAEWESNYEPVLIAGKCLVYAPFHKADGSCPYEIMIEPRMSFGTAHHETTSLMLESLLSEQVEGKRVLDMGCGTGVLAILAYKMKAASVVAIDNDEWAYANSVDNMAKNEASAVEVLQGEASVIPGPGYDLIVANINRNVLLQDIPFYAAFLSSPGVLLLSGFYVEDLDQISAAAAQSGLIYHSFKSTNNWVAAKFIKERVE